VINRSVESFVEVAPIDDFQIDVGLCSDAGAPWGYWFQGSQSAFLKARHKPCSANGPFIA
jgi:hypothetical protein